MDFKSAIPPPITDILRVSLNRLFHAISLHGRSQESSIQNPMLHNSKFVFALPKSRYGDVKQRRLNCAMNGLRIIWFDLRAILVNSYSVKFSEIPDSRQQRCS